MFLILLLPLMSLASNDNKFFHVVRPPTTPLFPTTSTQVIQRVSYPLKVCAMIDCKNRKILNTNCDFVNGRGRFGCYNVEENVCTALPSRKFCFRSMNHNMTYVRVNKTSNNPTQYTLYTYKDPLCKVEEGYDKPITANCLTNNMATGKYLCDGSKSPLGIMCRDRGTFFNRTTNNNTKSTIKSLNNGSTMTTLLTIAFIVLIYL
ncbi:Uncharacterized protein QTN25_008369 [Entamoeba marina]